jgi:hypothetical protein
MGARPTPLELTALSSRPSGRQLRDQLADDAWPDGLIDRADQSGEQLTGEGG